MSSLEPDKPVDVNPYAAPQFLGPADVLPAEEDQDQAELRAFVGSNARYYLSRWGRPQGYGFNWAAFFFGPLWMAYRKMYRVCLLVLGATFLIGAALVLLFDVLQGQEMPTALDRGVDLAIAIVCGSMANGWYLKHAQRIIAGIHDPFANPLSRFEALRRRGGTSLLSALALLVGLIAVFGTMVWLAGELPDAP